MWHMCQYGELCAIAQMVSWGATLDQTTSSDNAAAKILHRKQQPAAIALAAGLSECPLSPQLDYFNLATSAAIVLLSSAAATIGFL